MIPFALTAALLAATPEADARSIRVFASAGLLTSPSGAGADLSAGIRCGVARHFALTLDVGYGTIGAAPSLQDRWWVMPALVFAIPLGRLRVDLGAGLGLATASGFGSWSEYRADRTTWAVELIPTVRGHATVSLELTRSVELFARADLAALLLEGNTIGIRSGEPRPGLSDTTWANLSFGVQFRLL